MIVDFAFLGEGDEVIEKPHPGCQLLFHCFRRLLPRKVRKKNVVIKNEKKTEKHNFSHLYAKV